MQIWQFCSCDKFVLALATPSTETTEGVPLVDAEAFGTPFASGEPAVALRSNSCGGCYTCQNTRSCLPKSGRDNHVGWLIHDGPVALNVVGFAKRPCGSARGRELGRCRRRCRAAYRTRHSVAGAV